MKTLNVKATNRSEIQSQWGFPIAMGKWATEPLFVRCNAKGEVNWDKAPIYKRSELFERGSVKVIS
jgi:hypothetical protein